MGTEEQIFRCVQEGQMQFWYSTIQLQCNKIVMKYSTLFSLLQIPLFHYFESETQIIYILKTGSTNN